jgi:hypothetical protein
MKNEIQLSTNRSVSITQFPSIIHTTLPKTMVRCGVGFGLLLFVGSIYAQSLIVAVSRAQFATYVEAQGDPVAIYPPLSKTTTSVSPVKEEIDRPETEYFPHATDHAIASAGLLGVSVQTGWGVANASATSQLWFSPLVDQTQIVGININFEAGSPYTDGSISLLDLTSNSELWNYNWNFINYAPADFSWDPSVGIGLANINVDTDFLALHQYELTMMTASNAGDDSESVQIQLTGLVAVSAVPEPSTTLFLAMCGASLMIFRRLRKSSTKGIL